LSAAWAIIVLLVAVLCTVAVAVAHSLLADEVRAWLPHLARRLVRGAAGRLPVEFRARYEADWLAELAAWEDRPISALAKAAHIRLKVREIRESLGGVQVRGERTKRAFDLVVAAALVCVLAPVLLAAALAIKLESRGPVFVSQPRSGRGGATFRLIRFRSLYVDADADVLSAIRLTRVGRFLRRFSLDELPQLFNVIRGDMSLVGPRPLIPHEAAALKEGQGSVRGEVRPGIIGLWQIALSGRRPYTFREMVKLDEEYVYRRSLRLDLLLLLASVAVFFRRH
jgi:lipopolysaccharide/colanic/teichoic acid biosynthesis glycosyltransferase